MERIETGDLAWRLGLEQRAGVDAAVLEGTELSGARLRIMVMPPGGEAVVIEVEGEGALDVGDLHIDVLGLPGTSPGSVGYYISSLGVVFTGDVIRNGEPGMVGDTYIDYTTQLASIGENLLTLPPQTRLLPDRGPATTSKAESKNFDTWI